MKRLWLHRVQYERLWRLPSIRTISMMSITTVILAAIGAVVAPAWLPFVALALGAAAIIVAVRRHRHLIALEIHMVRALTRSFRGRPSDVDLPGLSANVRAEAMPDGVTRIEAESWLDAVRALGFVTARDRGFQMDWLRRMAAGRLSEVCGSPTLPLDAGYRSLALAGVASRALEGLEEQEIDLLEAFASGVMAAWNHDGPPFECQFLSYRPEPWTAADSLLIALLLFHGLSWKEEAKRAEAVIRRVLPPSVAQFFLPGDSLAGPVLPNDLGRFRAPADPAAGIVMADAPVAGSNCWVQSGSEGPTLGCDLHLPLTMPNPLYEVDLQWSGKRVRGLIAAGLPVVLTGSNGHLVWGVTNLSADAMDLVPAGGEDEEGSELATHRERIRVRGRPDAVFTRAGASAGPLSPKPLLGENVVVRWTGYDRRTCDLKFQRVAQAASVGESIALLDQANGIPLNVLIADESGRMAHLATGLLPRRVHCSGVSDGYLAGTERPRLIDPPEGVLVSANDAALPEHPYRIGYDFDPGYRARRARCMLMQTRAADPSAMRAMQHDTRAELYIPYRDAAVSALRGSNDDLAAILAEWNGNADVDSLAFGVLVRLREVLAQRVLSPYLSVCRDHDPEFRYAFHCIDRPVWSIIQSGNPSLLPLGEEGGGWDGFIARCVDEAVAELGGSPAGRKLPNWGELNRVGLKHPLEELAPWASSLLGMAARPQAGALHCVRTCVPGFSAVGRAVLKPGPQGSAEFHTPGGQSGHPLSRHYDDRHRDWSRATGKAARRPRQGSGFVLRATKYDVQETFRGGSGHVAVACSE